jgi:cytochrome-b5 reductase
VNEFDQVALIGGGSGITPLYQILTHALRDRTNTTKFTLLYGNLTEADILLREEFDNLKRKYPNTFDVVYFVDKLSDKSKSASINEGYITKADIQKYGPSPDLGQKVKVFVCGAYSSLLHFG